MPSGETKEILEAVERMLSNKIGLRRGREGTPKKLTPKQLDTLKKYKEYYEQLPSARGGKVKPMSIWNVVMCLRNLGLFLKERGVHSYEEAKKEDILAYSIEMNRLSEISRARFMVMIRAFFKWLYGIREKHKYPEVVDDARLVPITPKNKKRPQDLLTQEEIKRMLEVAESNRARSIIMLSLGEGGMRAGEIASLNIGSVEFDSRGVKVWIEKSKSKERYVRLVFAEPYLREYINNEYVLDKKEPSNPLFYCITGSTYKRRLGRVAFSTLLQRVGKKAGIKKRIYTHLGRAINISYLTKKGMSAEISAKRFGITPATLRNVYLTIDDKDVDEVYLRTHGKLSDKEKEEMEKEEHLLVPKLCPRCNRKNPINALYCNCGMVLDQTEALRIEQGEKAMNERIDDFLTPEAIQKLFKTMYKIQKEITEMKGG